jgi:hypothetical protein
MLTTSDSFQITGVAMWDISSAGNIIINGAMDVDQVVRPDCVAGHAGLELRNVAANYRFERSHRFAGIQPNSGFGDYSRLSCSAGNKQLGAGFCRDLQQALCTDVGHHSGTRCAGFDRGTSPLFGDLFERLDASLGLRIVCEAHQRPDSAHANRLLRIRRDRLTAKF